MKHMLTIALALLCIPAAVAQTDEEMRREVEAEYQRLKQADEARRQQRAASQAEAARQQARAEADAARRRANPPVTNSAWDASVRQVVEYLKRALRDPGSYESIEWSNVVEQGDGYMVRHKYRARNGFGGYNVSNNVFLMDSLGNVIQVLDYPDR